MPLKDVEPGTKTLEEKVDEILEDTSITLEDKLDAIRLIVDAILVDTSTTLEDKLDAIRPIVDAILVDTSTTLEDKIDAISTLLTTAEAEIDAIEAKLDNATYSLNALKILLDALEVKLDDATYGLSALQKLILGIEWNIENVNWGLYAISALIAAVEGKLDVPANFMADVSALALEATLGTHDTDIKAKVDRKVSPMLFLSVIDDVIDLPATAADTDLPNVVISGIPDGATLTKVLVFVKVRAIENTSATGANTIQGAQNIRIKKSTGTWGVDDIIAIPLTDNMWTIAKSTREFGDVIGGDDAHDVKGEVDENATYNLRFEDADVDYDYLRLNDVQVMIKVWFT